MPLTLAVADHLLGTKAPIAVGWILASHQVGSAIAAFFAGALHTASGYYLDCGVTAGFVAA